jgi:hypothetical protein
VEVNEEEEEDKDEVMSGEGREERGNARVEVDEDVALGPIATLSLPSEGSVMTVVIARTRTGSSGSLEESPNHKTGKLMECDQ